MERFALSSLSDWYSRWLLALSMVLLGATFWGNAVAAEEDFLDDVNIVTMSSGERELLRRAVIDFLQNSDDGQSGHWSNTALGNPVAIDVEFSVNHSAASDASFTATFCRQLTLILHADGKVQDLSRKVCTRKSDKFDIDVKDAVPLVYPAFLSEVTVITLNAREKAGLTAAAVDALKSKQDDTTTIWSNKGLGKQQALTVDITVAKLAPRPGGFGECRDLIMVLHTKKDTQTLTRRSCLSRTGFMDIEPGHEYDE